MRVNMHGLLLFLTRPFQWSFLPACKICSLWGGDGPTRACLSNLLYITLPTRCAQSCKCLVSCIIATWYSIRLRSVCHSICISTGDICIGRFNVCMHLDHIYVYTFIRNRDEQSWIRSLAHFFLLRRKGTGAGRVGEKKRRHGYLWCNDLVVEGAGCHGYLHPH